MNISAEKIQDAANSLHISATKVEDGINNVLEPELKTTRMSSNDTQETTRVLARRITVMFALTAIMNLFLVLYILLQH